MNNVKKQTVCLKDIPTPPVYVPHAQMLIRQYKRRNLPDTALTDTLFLQLELMAEDQEDAYVNKVKARKKMLDDNELADPHMSPYARKLLYKKLGL
tara:strand:+ start:773 stop:1060 length:288 start_codon:yes stop_codon:yes gene_type:complete